MTKTPQNRKSENRVRLENPRGKRTDSFPGNWRNPFPASDPPAATQPGSGITGPEVTKRDTNGLSSVAKKPSGAATSLYKLVPQRGRQPIAGIPTADERADALR